MYVNIEFVVYKFNSSYLAMNESGSTASWKNCIWYKYITIKCSKQ